MKEDRKKKKKSGGKVQVKEKHKKKNKKNQVGEEFLEEESEEWLPEEESEEWVPEEESEEWVPEEESEEWPQEEAPEEWLPEEDPQNSAIEVIEIGDDMFEDDVEPEAEEEDYMDELIRSKKLENQPSLAQKRGQDERAMIREQERLAQEKKRKKRGKRRNIIIGTVAAVLVVGIWFVGWGYNLIFGTDTTASMVEIVVESGQEVVYAKLTSVKGNEITYTVAEAVETAEDADTEGTAADGELPSDSADGEMPSGTTDGELPEGFDGEMSGDFDGDLPEGFDGEISGDFDGELPEGFDGEMPSGGSDSTGSDTAVPSAQGQSSSTGSVKATSLISSSADSYTTVNIGMGGGFSGGGSFDMGSFDFGSFDFSSFGESSSTVVTSSASDTFTYNDVTYQLTDESNTMLIPVGTDVTTRLGTVTTFSRLAAGDCVALVMQEVDGENVIMAVYIIG